MHEVLPPLIDPSLPKTSLTTLLSLFSTQLLSLAPKAFWLILCVWLTGLTGTGFGQSFPMIITCQLPLENCREDHEIQSQASLGWLGSGLFFVCLFACLNLWQQPPLPWGGGGFCCQQSRKSPPTHTFPLRFGQV